MRKRKLFPEFLAWFLGLFLIAIAGVLTYAIATREEEPSAMEISEGIPTINIELNNVELENIRYGDKETKYPGNTVIINDGSTKTEYANVELKGRGNSTWYGPDKKPWQLKFEQETELLGIKGGKKWVLLADYYDPSHLRNHAALELGNMLEMPYVKVGKAVEVSFDGEYEGLFYLVPKVDIAKNAVNLEDKWGLLVELDDMRFDAEYYISYAKNVLFVKEAVAAKNDTMKQEAMTDFMVQFNELEKAVKEKRYDKVQELADVESFVDVYLVNEFSVNPDAYAASFFMYKDGAEDKIHAGPIWDYDLAFGNHAWNYAENLGNFYSPRETMVQANWVFNQLVYGMMKIPEFKAEVKRVFQEKMAGRSEEYLAILKGQIAEIQEAAKKDAEKWKYDTLESETEYVINWIEERYKYFEEVYGGA